MYHILQTCKLKAIKIMRMAMKLSANNNVDNGKGQIWTGSMNGFS